jgi:uncharacterized protein
MIIDFHTHIFPDELAVKAIDKLKQHAPGAMNYTDGTLSGLKASMKAAGIDVAVTLPIATKPEQVDTINKGCAVLKSTEIVPFGTIHPETKDIDAALDILVRDKIQGIKLHPEYQDFYIDDPWYFPIYDALSARNLIVVFHAGKDPGPFTCDHALPPALRRVHTAFPRLTIVASHMGGWQVWPEVEEELAGLPIWFDTSATAPYLDKNEFVRIVRKHGVERILFGTDSPWFDARETLDWIAGLPLSSAEKEKILGRNARQLLAL